MTMKLYYEKDEDRITTDATIAHYGVKGMRWGVRRENLSRSNVKKAAKKVGKKIAPMDIEAMKKDPVLNAAARAAKRSGQFGKYMVTPQTDSVRGGIAGVKAKAHNLLAGRQEAGARAAAKDAASFRDGVKQIDAQLKSGKFQGKEGKRQMKDAKLEKSFRDASKNLKEQAKVETNPKKRERMLRDADSMDQDARTVKEFSQRKDAKSVAQLKQMRQIFKDSEAAMTQMSKEWAASAAQNRAKAKQYESQADASYKKQMKRNYGFGFDPKTNRPR